jgi:mannitol-1-phosphate 5-dehydrogenase
MPKFLQYGTGNIARSLMGQLFSRAGYEIVFVGRNQTVIDALNRERKYLIQVKDRHLPRGGIPRIGTYDIWVENVRAVSCYDEERVIDEITSADLMATAIGPDALPQIYEIIAASIKKRDKPLNILICENLRHMSRVVRSGLKNYFPKSYPFSKWVGLIETTIGKMVPLMPEAIREKDPLLIWAEAYNLLFVDKNGFIGDIPKVDEMIAKENFDAYVDRKLFIHNLGHAVIAYAGYFTNPSHPYIWQAISLKPIEEVVRAAMWESGQALIKEYPGEFDEQIQREYIEDLIQRFNNPHLNDTVYRVGRDIPRKLGPNERLIGASMMDIKHGIIPRYTALAIAAGFFFRATDEKGELFPKDSKFHADKEMYGINFILDNVCGLDPEKDKTLMAKILEAYEFLCGAKSDSEKAQLLKKY